MPSRIIAACERSLLAAVIETASFSASGPNANSSADWAASVA